MGTADAYAQIGVSSTVGACAVWILVGIPESGLVASGTVVVTAWTLGTATRHQVALDSVGGVKLVVTNTAIGTTLLDTAFSAAGSVAAGRQLVALELVQDGADIDYTVRSGSSGCSMRRTSVTWRPG
jgi:hypothetical protein